MDQVPIPLDAGIKLNGRAGNWNLALLDVQTSETTVSDEVAKNLGLPSSLVPGTNLLAGRVSYDVNENLRIGMVYTSGDPAGYRQNTLLGSDAVWRTSKFLGNKNLSVGAWAATTQGDVGPGSRIGWGARIAFPNDLYNCGAEIFDYGQALKPLLGFLPRPGVRHSNFNCVYAPRPSKTGRFGWIRQQTFRTKFDRYTNTAGINESRFFDLSMVTEFQSGDKITVLFEPQGETLLLPFRIAPGVVIPVGIYNYLRLGLQGQSSNYRALQAGFTTYFGNFYSGRMTQTQTYVKWTSPKGRIQLQANYDNNYGNMPQGRFVTRLWYLQAAFAWNPNLVLNSFVQYNLNNVGTSTRLRWTMKPGNDLFIVWTRGWQRLLTAPDLSLTPQDEVVAIKLRWTFRY